MLQFLPRQVQRPPQTVPIRLRLPSVSEGWTSNEPEIYANPLSKWLFVSSLRRYRALQNELQPPWDSQGWWTIDPGNTVYVANTCNRYLYFYAEAVDGAYWAGPYQFEVAEGVFDFCPTSGIGFSGATAGTRQIDDNIGDVCWPWDSYTLELIA